MSSSSFDAILDDAEGAYESVAWSATPSAADAFATAELRRRVHATGIVDGGGVQSLESPPPLPDSQRVGRRASVADTLDAQRARSGGGVPPPTLSREQRLRRAYARAWARGAAWATSARARVVALYALVRTWTSPSAWAEWAELTRVRVEQSRATARLLDAFERRGDAARCIVLTTSFVSALLTIYSMVFGAAYVVGVTDADFDDPATVAFARAGAPHVNFSARSLDLTCDEIRTHTYERRSDDGVPISFARVHAYAEHALAHGGSAAPPCVCAPMFGRRRRHLALRFANGTIEHLYNVRDVTPPDTASTTFSLVTEHQRMLEPERTESVANVRRDYVHVEFTTRACGRGTLVVRDALAWCVAPCLDLMDGTTVYERAAADSLEPALE